MHPGRVFGIAAGDGTMKKEFSCEDLNKIRKLKKDFM